ncbi:MAG: hypothetical protein WBA46_09695 [Thermomicrobiales bacterium]
MAIVWPRAATENGEPDDVRGRLPGMSTFHTPRTRRTLLVSAALGLAAILAPAAVVARSGDPVPEAIAGRRFSAIAADAPIDALTVIVRRYADADAARRSVDATFRRYTAPIVNMEASISGVTSEPILDGEGLLGSWTILAGVAAHRSWYRASFFAAGRLAWSVVVRSDLGPVTDALPVTIDETLLARHGGAATPTVTTTTPIGGDEDALDDLWAFLPADDAFHGRFRLDEEFEQDDDNQPFPWRELRTRWHRRSRSARLP